MRRKPWVCQAGGASASGLGWESQNTVAQGGERQGAEQEAHTVSSGAVVLLSGTGGREETDKHWFEKTNNRIFCF